MYNFLFDSLICYNILSLEVHILGSNICLYVINFWHSLEQFIELILKPILGTDKHSFCHFYDFSLIIFMGLYCGFIVFNVYLFVCFYQLPEDEHESIEAIRVIFLSLSLYISFLFHTPRWYSTTFWTEMPPNSHKFLNTLWL